MAELNIKVLQPSLERSPFSFFFRFFIGQTILKLKSKNINLKFEFELRIAFNLYCNALKIVPETCYYQISDKPFDADLGKWSYLKGVINLESKGTTSFKTPFKHDGDEFISVHKNKKNQVLISQEILILESEGKNIFFVLYYHKNPKAKKGKLLIDLTSGN